MKRKPLYLSQQTTKQIKTTTMTIQLQSIGRVNASLAQDITPGTVLMWNFGETSTIVEIVKQTAKTITVKERSDRSGAIYERRFNKTRKVAIVK